MIAVRRATTTKGPGSDRWRALLTAATAALGLAALVVPTGAAQARPYCDGPTPPPICDGAGGGRPEPEPRPDRPPQAVVDWSVPARTVAEGTGWQQVEMAPQVWPVDVDGCRSTSDGAATYEWSVDGTVSARTLGCRTRLQVAGLGDHRLQLRVVAAKGTSTAGIPMTLRDTLIVSLGDSISSGEGNPDVTRGQRDYAHAEQWESERCHRSRKAAPALAAVQLEDRDPRSSVTFVHLACSGASITTSHQGDGGILAPQAGFIGASAPLPPQIAEATARVAGRSVDVVLLTAGANDLGFGEIVERCLADKYCDDNRSWIRPRSEAFLAQQLPARYDLLAGEIARTLAPRRVLVSEYADPTRDERNRICDPLISRTADGGRISRREAAWASQVVVGGLNLQIREAAARNAHLGWEPVAAEAAFATHGYCSDRDRRIVRITESLRDQRDTRGSLHPNAAGHRELAARLVAALDGNPIR